MTYNGKPPEKNGVDGGNKIATENENGSAKDENVDSISQIVEKKDWNYFWKRVISDITNKDLIPVKILFFFQYATLFVLYPFLTLHMAELGLDEWEIGINQATAPVVAVLGPPFVGMLADKIGNFKILLSFMTLVNAGMALLLLLVPVARETVPLPNFVTFELSCDNSISNHFTLSSLDTSLCSLNYNHSLEDSPSWSRLPSVPIHCGMMCSSQNENSKNAMEQLPYSRFIELKPFPQNATMMLPNGKSFMTYKQKEPVLGCSKRSEGDQQECGLDYRSTTPFEDQTNSKSSVDGEHDDSKVEIEIEFLKYLYLNNQTDQNFNGNVTELKMEVSGGFTFHEIMIDEAVCTRNQNDTEELTPPDTEERCLSTCLVQYDREIFCHNTKERKIYNVGLTFGIYTLFRLLLGFASATSFVMFEGAVLAIMKQYGGDYGLQRVSATLAAIIVAPLSGMMLRAFGFRPVIYLYAALKAFSAFVTLAIDLEFKKPAERVVRNLKEVLSRVEILVFFLAMLWSGTAWGYLETFLFLYIERMGGSRLLMGLTISVGGIAGLPLLIFSRPIIKRLGHVNCLCLGLLFYSFRYFGYSLVTDPWQVLIFEALEAVTVSLAITAASTYAVALSSLQTIASIQGIFGCLYFGIGRGAGSLMGGILIKSVGHVQTFRIFGIGSLIGAILYFIANLLYIRKHSIAHTGLDINNLNLPSKENINGGGGKAVVPPVSWKKGKNNKKDQESQKEKELDGGQVQIDGGYLGPLAINKFTDVPLDEDGP